MKNKIALLFLAVLLVGGRFYAFAEGQLEAFSDTANRINETLQGIDTTNQQTQQQTSTTTPIANGVINVYSNADGTVLKTLVVDPAEARLTTLDGSFRIRITNPARLAVDFTNVVHSDLYQVQLPRTINRRNGQAVVGAQFAGTRYGGNCGVTILSNQGNIFKVQIEGDGTFYTSSNERIPAYIAGIIEATYIGAVNADTPQSTEDKTQQAMELMKQLGL